MRDAVINIKTDIRTKNRAQKVAEELGFSLSTLANAYFRSLIKTKAVHFSANPQEVPNEFMVQALKEAEAGKTSPAFDDVEDAIKWLDDDNRKYAD